MILIGLCLEKHGPSLAIYPSIEAAASISKARGSRVRVIIPTYEFAALGLYPASEADEIGRQAKRVLSRYDFEAVDTLNDENYKTRRLDKAFRIQKLVDGQSRDPLGDKNTGLQLACMEIADILLCLEESHTLLIADQGSAIPAMRAHYVAKKHLPTSNRHELGCLFYLEPTDITRKELMYHTEDRRKIYLKPGEAGKVLNAVTTGGNSIDDFHKHGGNYNECPVGEIESLVANDDATVKENCRRCESGSFPNGCREHKELVQIQLKNFLGAFR